MATPTEVLDVDGRRHDHHPQKPYFRLLVCQLDLVCLRVAGRATAAGGRDGLPPVNGIDGQAFYQKRAPENGPD
jgi:hypothetical protein